MPVDCQKSSSGGKGNVGMVIEREPRVCAAGLPTAQLNDCVGYCLEHYLLKDKVDALISDAIVPPNKPLPAPPLRHLLPLDKRYAGPFRQVQELINPPIKTKFQTLVEDFKDTSYSSYWRKPFGETKDQTPMLPEGLDMYGTTFGKKTEFHGYLYDIIMPKEPLIDKTPELNKAGVQIKRNYCTPAYNSDLTFGCRSFVDKRGTYAKCCMTDDRILLGKTGHTIVNTIQSNNQDKNQARIGSVLAPNNNINGLPQGYTFGKVNPPANIAGCLSFCEFNPDFYFFRKCLGHLNSLRKYLSKRFLPTFFHKFYLNLKFLDTEKCNWLSKLTVYTACSSKLIRFETHLIEPLLTLWNAFDGSKINYYIFVHIINNREPLPDLPRIIDLASEILDFHTTYSEMMKPNQERDERLMAGLPSGRYFDLDYTITPERCSKADRICLPHESDVRACISPSVLTLHHVNHRDMFAKREPNVIRGVFEAAGESFSDNKFNEIWEAAKKYHSEGWVCYETFRQALQDYYINNDNKDNKQILKNIN